MKGNDWRERLLSLQMSNIDDVIYNFLLNIDTKLFLLDERSMIFLNRLILTSAVSWTQLRKNHNISFRNVEEKKCKVPQKSSTWVNVLDYIPPS